MTDMMRRTKIICTLGPATVEPAMIERLIDAGMNVARLNYSHGTRALHAASIRMVREAARAKGKPVAILQDLQGPKIRVGVFAGGEALLEEGAAFIITADPVEGNARRASTTFANLPADVAPGGMLLLDDGYIILRVEAVRGADIETRVVKGGVLKDHKGIVAPGIRLSASAVSGKDLADLESGLAEGVDLVALSFVQSEQDVIALRAAMRRFGRIAPIVAKIERCEGITDIEDIIREADAVMVARGDLGLEMDAEEVPVLQKKIIARCNYHGKPVITATQMLESMIEHPRPTRAEASDVANAVIDGSDAVMLSGETSVGRYPAEAVGYLHRIILKTEAEEFRAERAAEIPADPLENIADAIGRACCVLAGQIGAAAIVPLTTSGGTARVIAKHRPRTPIVALTDNEATLRQLALVWGVTPLLVPGIPEGDATLESLKGFLRDRGLARAGEAVVFTAGIPLRIRTSTNMLQVGRV